MREFRNDITYNQLITFKAIFEAGNISRASKQLKISPASVSSSLKSLERQIGQTLFVRTTRSMSPTEVGTQLYNSTRYAIGELFAAVDVVCDANNTPSGKLSLNMASTIYQWFLKEALAEFQHTYPKVQLDLTLSDTLDSRVEHQIDVGFRYGERVDESLIARPINPRLDNDNQALKAALFMSKDYAGRHGIPQSIDELAGHPMVKFRMPSSQKLAPLRLHQTPDPASEILNIETPTAMVVNDMGALVDMVTQGFGMGMMMDRILRTRFASGDLVPVLESHWCDIPTIYMYHARESRQSLKVRCFLDFMAERFNQKR